MSDTPSSPHATQPHHQAFWLWVMCLTGVDYFSTLGYQPSVAYTNTGMLTPLATLVLVLVTLFGALPVYAYVAGKSPHGHGSIGMLERLVHGWTGKFMVLVLLGFAGTDFVITKTLSAADAAEHLIGNPYWPIKPAKPSGDGKAAAGETPPSPVEPDRRDAGPTATGALHAAHGSSTVQIVVTMTLLVLLGAMFLRGFGEVISLAVVIVGVYLTLNLIVVGSGLLYLEQHPERFWDWWRLVQAGDWRLPERPLAGSDLTTIILVCLILFPKLALGLSGFETGVAVMSLVRGRPDDTHETPTGRIRNTRKLLAVAALIMSTFLLGSALVTCTLISPDALGPGGKADNRTLAYLAHGETGLPINPLFGDIFGTVYDLSTVVILWFAGASAMAGLLNLVPQYLPRYGMAPDWARAVRPLVMLFTVINVFVTWIFKADVHAQSDAYATGVLVLMSSACIATVIERWRAGSGFWGFRVPWYFGLVTLVFLYTTASVILGKPVGLQIASFFIAAIIVSSLISRAMRSTELRFGGFQFKDETSRLLWGSMRDMDFPVLVPHRPGGRDLAAKEESIRREHRLSSEVFIVFIEATLGDTSDFYQEPIMEVIQQEGRFIIRVERCASIAHVIAALGLELSTTGKPPEIHFGWSAESPLAANLGFLLFGEGNVPWLVRELILKAQPDMARQPRVIIG